MLHSASDSLVGEIHSHTHVYTLFQMPRHFWFTYIWILFKVSSSHFSCMYINMDTQSHSHRYTHYFKCLVISGSHTYEYYLKYLLPISYAYMYTHSNTFTEIHTPFQIPSLSQFTYTYTHIFIHTHIIKSTFLPLYICVCVCVYAHTQVLREREREREEKRYTLFQMPSYFYCYCLYAERLNQFSEERHICQCSFITRYAATEAVAAAAADITSQTTCQ